MNYEGTIDRPAAHGYVTGRTSVSSTHGDLLEAGAQTQWLPIAALLPADSPRLDGENTEHTRMLAEAGAKLPPVIVHRETMRVIDGMHRLGAALLRGDDQIEVRFFDGSVQEAFVLAVKTNIAHGRPLSLVDRTSAVERIIIDHPTWSDRSIAATVGLGARTVGGIRRRVEAVTDGGVEPSARIGRDGRVRPLDNATGRLKAAEIIKTQPDASLREIAKSSGVSPTTARDVRNRIQRGDDPVPEKRSAGSMSGTMVLAPQSTRHATEPALESILQGLQRDPSLRFSESGRTLLRWILSRAVQPGEWQDIGGEVPTHSTYIIANVARRFADEWLHIADDLERRSRQIA